jgi:hypothetical protein
MWIPLVTARPSRAAWRADDLQDPDDDSPPEAPAPSGWHESSWALATGVDVIELPPSAAAAWFA